MLGVLCFLIPFTSTMLSLCQLAGAEPPYTLVGFTGDYYMIGGIGMILAGLAEFILGNSTCWHHMVFAAKLTEIQLSR